jgi:hypothetical protein
LRCSEKSLLESFFLFKLLSSFWVLPIWSRPFCFSFKVFLVFLLPPGFLWFLVSDIPCFHLFFCEIFVKSWLFPSLSKTCERSSSFPKN